METDFYENWTEIFSKLLKKLNTKEKDCVCTKMCYLYFIKKMIKYHVLIFLFFK